MTSEILFPPLTSVIRDGEADESSSSFGSLGFPQDHRVGEFRILLSVIISGG